MDVCQKCHRTFPAELINTMELHILGRRVHFKSCPICALAIKIEIHHLPLDTEFEGEKAQMLLETAREYVRSRSNGKN